MNYKLALRSINRLLTILKKDSIFDVITVCFPQALKKVKCYYH